MLRSATSVGANINEAIYDNSKADFISKPHISLKETGASIDWLKLLKNTKLVNYDFDSLLSLAEEIKRMRIASLNTAKENGKNIFFVAHRQQKSLFCLPDKRDFSHAHTSSTAGTVVGSVCAFG